MRIILLLCFFSVTVINVESCSLFQNAWVEVINGTASNITFSVRYAYDISEQENVTGYNVYKESNLAPGESAVFQIKGVEPEAAVDARGEFVSNSFYLTLDYSLTNTVHIENQFAYLVLTNNSNITISPYMKTSCPENYTNESSWWNGTAIPTMNAFKSYRVRLSAGSYFIMIKPSSYPMFFLFSDTNVPTLLVNGSNLGTTVLKPVF